VINPILTGVPVAALGVPRALLAAVPAVVLEDPEPVLELLEQAVATRPAATTPITTNLGPPRPERLTTDPIVIR
jgi:hypothetical protein